MDGKIVLGPGTLISIKDLCVLQITNNTVSAHMGYNNAFYVDFTSNSAAQCQYDGLLLELKKFGLVPISKNFAVVAPAIVNIFRKSTWKTKCLCARKYVGERGIIQFQHNYRWKFEFSTEEKANRFLAGVIEQIRTSAK